MSAEHDAVKEQLANPKARKADHIRLSTVWVTTQNIRKIQSELAQGYSFDKDKMQDLVNAMFAFINSVVAPQEVSEDKPAEVVHDTITD